MAIKFIFFIALISVGCKADLTGVVNDSRSQSTESQTEPIEDDKGNKEVSTDLPASSETPKKEAEHPTIVTFENFTNFSGKGSESEPFKLAQLVGATGAIVFSSNENLEVKDISCEGLVSAATLNSGKIELPIVATEIGESKFSCAHVSNQKKIFFELLVSKLPCEALAGDSFYGNGTADDPYLICNMAHLIHLSEHSDLWTAYFKLDADIQASGLKKPIGYRNASDPSTAIPFSGTFDGNGHSISSLALSGLETEPTRGTALFSFLKNGTVKNLVLINPEVKVYQSQNNAILVGSMINSVVSHITIESGRLLPIDDSSVGPEYSAAVVGSAF